MLPFNRSIAFRARFHVVLKIFLDVLSGAVK
jgi:hypothetical protein